MGQIRCRQEHDLPSRCAHIRKEAWSTPQPLTCARASAAVAERRESRAIEARDAAAGRLRWSPWICVSLQAGIVEAVDVTQPFDMRTTPRAHIRQMPARKGTADVGGWLRR